MPMGPPVMGGANPQNLQALAAAGDPQAIAMLQQMQAAQGAQPGGGMPPMQGAGPMPGMGQLSPQGGGAPVSPDVAARRAQDLIRILRARGG